MVNKRSYQVHEKTESGLVYQGLWYVESKTSAIKGAAVERGYSGTDEAAACGHEFVATEVA